MGWQSSQEAYQLYFGDIHRHSAVSDGMGQPEEHFRAARDIGRLDFYALTDHARLTLDPTANRAYMTELVGPRGTTEGATLDNLTNILEIHTVHPEEWEALKRIVRRYYEPRHFVTFLAYEWSCPRYGDHNVYYREDDGDLILPDALPDLYAALEDLPALIIPHHTGYAVGRRGKSWNHHHPRLERLVEVFSHHGSSECTENNPYPLRNIGMGENVAGSSVRDALMRGYYLGLTGGGDAHSPDQAFVLTGVYAPELTRDAIFDALWARRTFATTGSRIRLYFAMDDQLMGSIYSTDTPPTIQIGISGTAPLDWVEVIRNGEVMKRWAEIEGDQVAFTHVDRDTPIRPDNFYYLRVRQRDGAMAWSSPIWVTFLPELEAVRGYLYWVPDQACTLQVEEEQSNGGVEVTLRCINDHPKRTPIFDIEFGIQTVPPSEAVPLTSTQATRLEPGTAMEARFQTSRSSGAEEESTSWISYRTIDDDVRTVLRRFPTARLS
jgi:hypothetical protein